MSGYRFAEDEKSIARTQLRHDLLAAVSRGRVRMVGSGEWDSKSNPSTRPQIARALNSLWKADCIDVINEGRVELSDKGRSLLSAWDGRSS